MARLCVRRYANRAPLQAHVLGHPVAVGEQLVRGEQPSEATVAVGHRMDGKDTEDQCTSQDQRVADLVALGGVIPVEGFAQKKLDLAGWGRLEDDLADAALVGHDVVGIAREIAATTSSVLEQLPVPDGAATAC